jgi:hypothetical protein
MNPIAFRTALLVSTLVACQQGATSNSGADQPLIAVAPPVETSNAAVTSGRYLMAGRCLIFRTTDARTFLPLFGHAVSIAGPALGGSPGASAITLDRLYSVSGSPIPEGSVPEEVAPEVLSQCRYPIFRVGVMREGEPAPPPNPPS